MRENRTQIDYHIRKQIEQSFRKLGFERDNSCRERQGILGQQYVWRRTKNTTTEPQVSSVLLENKNENAIEEDLNDDDLPF
jgi:type IV secretory pathway VirD2 relaxase